VPAHGGVTHAQRPSSAQKHELVHVVPGTATYEHEMPEGVGLQAAPLAGFVPGQPGAHGVSFMFHDLPSQWP
jgi:hypothetical protein